ncbi:MULTISPECIES: BTAD domain-containing putative transcriptional regulator [unclassified Micromonospora]|uniref:BTAD domain-containing putative transcriptional regulator n=2 Tax=Micromonospora TaxID=1873 RepID=UPI001128DBA2|nr:MULTISPECIES: BTAD domain-containing putative transcriptional regulator [unclassified Micromonospora]MCK1807028.1 winged helix-turn-helix domain-containing protein [Micromonospora sp. R42106]MCK1831692.1 winged helix-turn-helix domain-containing protein [Micromonospora sp. R42003]MCK1842592.1 winged helix-turn-helix domain-containing protein [Micromonospora sp. R42004]MCM1014972.1 winged helix-turn-helix domain-containing protein [Micromonospora sp. XM-20-01]
MPVGFGVLGPVTAWDDAGEPVDLKGPRHRAVLARLVAARGRVVPVGQIVDDLWDDPPAGAVGAVRTFVAALRRRLEPRRPPREAARLLVTEGPGYALRADPGAVDAWRFEDTVSAVADALPRAALDRLDEALGWWRGPAYADFDQPWAHAERSRLDQIRLTAVERRAEALLALDRAADAVPDLDAHVAAYPWREDGWALLASALYRAGRQADALAVLRRARELLRDQLGLDPGPRLRRLETDLLRQTEPEPTGAARVWAETAAAYERSVVPGARARLESTVGLLRSLAVTGPGGLEAARDHREAAISAAEQLGDPEFTARVIGGYDVPAIWTRSDDPAQAARVVAAAQRALAGLGPDAPEATRARLLATVAIESRGTASPGPAQSAREAEAIARRVADPALLAQALNGVYMQTFQRAGLAPQRDAVGVELVALAARHGLATVEILGHLIRVQARSALADFTTADAHADAADRLAARHESPLVGVFTGGYRAMRTAATGAAYPDAEATYRSWATGLAGCGMPGVERGLLPLALLCLRVWHDRPAGFPADTDWGPYAPWARPLVLLSAGRRDEAASALRRTPAPPRDLLQEALWCLTGRAAVALGDRDAMLRARDALVPAAGEVAGAGSGLLTVGPVAAHLDRITAALLGSPG